MIKIAIQFTAGCGDMLPIINGKLIDLKLKLDVDYGCDGYDIHSCHVPNYKLETYIGTTIFENIFGTNYKCELSDKSVVDIVDNIKEYRKKLAFGADVLVLLLDDKVNDVSIELEAFRGNKIICI